MSRDCEVLVKDYVTYVRTNFVWTPDRIDLINRLEDVHEVH